MNKRKEKTFRKKKTRKETVLNVIYYYSHAAAAEAEVLMMMDRAGCVLVGYTARGAAAEANYRRHIRTQRNNNNKN